MSNSETKSINSGIESKSPARQSLSQTTQKKSPVANHKKVTPTLYFSQYMETIVKQNQDETFCCILCRYLEKKSVYRHIIVSTKDQTDVNKRIDRESHEFLILKI